MAATTVVTRQIADNAVTNAKIAQVPANTLRGNNTASTANVADLTIDQINDMLNVWGIEYVSSINCINFLPIY